MIVKLSLLLLVLSLGGCSLPYSRPTSYSHPTKNLHDLERDKRECTYLAKRTLAAQGVKDP